MLSSDFILDISLQKTAQELRQRETDFVSNFHSTGKL